MSEADSRPYLSIPNWEKYQPRLKNGKPNRDWIRLQNNLEDSKGPDGTSWMSLSDGCQDFLVRLWRYVGRTGSFPLNDPHQLHMQLRYRHHTVRMLASWRDDAIRIGFLVPSNQQSACESAPRDVTRRDVTKKKHKEHVSSAPRQEDLVSEPPFWQGQILQVSNKSHAALIAAYPSLDFDYQCKKADEWLVNNPANRKKDLPRFISNWFRRAQSYADSRSIGGNGNGNGHRETFGQSLNRHNEEVADFVMAKIARESFQA